MKKLKIGFVIKGSTINAYEKDLIKQLSTINEQFEKPILISFNYKKKRFFLNNLLIKLINLFEIYIIKKNKIFNNYSKIYNLNILDLKVIRIDDNLLKDIDINSINKEKLDMIVSFENNFQESALQSKCNINSIFVQKGDNRFTNCDVAGFWETYLDKPTTGFTIKILLNNSIKHNIFRGNFMTRSLWHENKAMIEQKSIFFLKSILLDFYKKEFLIKNEDLSEEKNIINKDPSFINLIHYMFREYVKIVASKINRYRKIKKKWSVSFINKTNLNIDVNKLITIKNPENRFLADPFVIKHKNRNICFVEDYNFDNCKGKISAYELFNNTYKEIGTVLTENFHLSFPFVFKHNEQVYMIPDTSEIREIRLYKCSEFPLKWNLEKVLIKNIDATDTVILKQNNKWFLLTNVCSSSIGEHNSELHIYESEDFLKNEWLKFNNNPIIFNSEKARNGGLFFFNNEYYRINQVHKKNTYGYSFQINKINVIEKNKYSEVQISEIKPTMFINSIGTHHFHMNEDFSVMDHLFLSK